MNLVEKILARASGRKAVAPGDIVVADVDCLLLHDLSGYITSRVFEKEVGRPMRYPDRVVMVFDHHFSPPTEERARVLEENRAFARRHGIHLFDCGSGNIHHVGVRNGFVRPGTVVVGSDSHTPVHGTLGCFAAGLGNNSHAGMVMPFGKAWFRVPETTRIELTGQHEKAVTPRDAALWLTGQIGEGGAVYRALHFAGDYIDDARGVGPLAVPADHHRRRRQVRLHRPGRQDARASSGSSPASRSTRCARTPPSEASETRARTTSASWSRRWRPRPRSATCTRSVELRRPGGAVGRARRARRRPDRGHQAGRRDPARPAHRARGEVQRGARPAAQVFAQACEEGLVADLFAAGCTWFPPSTGSNQAINMGAMAATEAMVSTHARNFPGRNGSPDAMMYLASASTVAASAVRGKLTDPREFLV